MLYPRGRKTAARLTKLFFVKKISYIKSCQALDCSSKQFHQNSSVSWNRQLVATG